VRRTPNPTYGSSEEHRPEQISDDGPGIVAQALVIGTALVSAWTAVRVGRMGLPIPSLLLVDFFMVLSIIAVLATMAANHRRLPIHVGSTPACSPPGYRLDCRRGAWGSAFICAYPHRIACRGFGA
jgi:hypothetical protein